MGRQPSATQSSRAQLHVACASEAWREYFFLTSSLAWASGMGRSWAALARVRFRTNASRALVTRQGLGANLPEDAIYPLNLADETGQPLDGAHKYTIHFD